MPVAPPCWGPDTRHCKAGNLLSLVAAPWHTSNCVPTFQRLATTMVACAWIFLSLLCSSAGILGCALFVCQLNPYTRPALSSSSELITSSSSRDSSNNKTMLESWFSQEYSISNTGFDSDFRGWGRLRSELSECLSLALSQRISTGPLFKTVVLYLEHLRQSVFSLLIWPLHLVNS